MKSLSSKLNEALNTKDATEEVRDYFDMMNKNRNESVNEAKTMTFNEIIAEMTANDFKMTKLNQKKYEFIAPKKNKKAIIEHIGRDTVRVTDMSGSTDWSFTDWADEIPMFQFENLNEAKTSKVFSIDTLSGSDSDKVRKILDSEKIKYDDKGAGLFDIHLDRQSLEASNLIAKLDKDVKYNEVNESMTTVINTDQLADYLNAVDIEAAKNLNPEESILVTDLLGNMVEVTFVDLDKFTVVYPTVDVVTESATKRTVAFTAKRINKGTKDEYVQWTLDLPKTVKTDFDLAELILSDKWLMNDLTKHADMRLKQGDIIVNKATGKEHIGADILDLLMTMTESITESAIKPSELKPNETYFVTYKDMEAFAEYKGKSGKVHQFDNSGRIIELTDDEVKKHVTNEALNEAKPGKVFNGTKDRAEAVLTMFSEYFKNNKKVLSEISTSIESYEFNELLQKHGASSKLASDMQDAFLNLNQKDYFDNEILDTYPKAKRVNESVTEAKSKYEIEVSVKTASLANDILRDNRNLNYTTDGSNCFIFRNRSEYDEALDILSDGGVEILESVMEAKVPTGYVAYDESIELSKGQTLELLMSSKLTTNDIKAIRAAKPFAMKIGFFEVEIAMTAEPKVKNTKSLAYDMSKIGGPADAFVVIVKK